MAVKILIADDHPMVRRGLKALLDNEPGFNVIGEAADGLTAIQLVERLQPDVVVVDLMMPGLGGLEVIRQIGLRTPKARCVVLSMHSDEAYFLKALQLGALGYVLKDADESELIQAVSNASKGKRFLSAALSERLVEALINKTNIDPELDPYETLTTREREVMQMAAQGDSNVDIANRLQISFRTVSTHRANLMKKLGLHNQTDLVRYAIEHKIIVTSEK